MGVADLALQGSLALGTELYTLVTASTGSHLAAVLAISIRTSGHGPLKCISLLKKTCIWLTMYC